MAKHKAVNTEDRIREALRLDIAKGSDLDWDILLDRDLIQMMYNDLGSLWRLGEELNITENRTREVVVIHGIKLNQQGGAYQQQRSGPAPITTREEMAAVGQAYGFSDTQLAMLRAYSSDRIRTCPDICPLGLFCWDGDKVGGRRKRSKCGLRDHLRATCLLGKSDETN